MFGWTKKKSEFLDKAIRKANLEEQRIRTWLCQEQFDRGRVLYEQRQLEVKRMQRADQIRRSEHDVLSSSIDKSVTEEIKNTATRTTINVDTGETLIYKRIGGEEVLVAHYENRIYGRDDNRL